MRTVGSSGLRILAVDDEEGIRLWLESVLTDAGHTVVAAGDGEEALAQIERHRFDVVISDIRLPKIDGLTLFRHLRQQAPQTEVILMTAFAMVSDAISALREGVYEYLIKPVDTDEILLHLTRIAEREALRRELEQARAKLAVQPQLWPIVAREPAMLKLLDRIATIAQSDSPVLIVGESGTGKELVAHTLHERSARSTGPFVAVNCAAFPETLLEAELFGHERGAFTGAIKKRDGRFKAAHGGTLLLDEIAEMPLAAQAKLLRVLQEGTFEPLGTNTPVRSDVRVISATHRNLKERIAQGRFREDLFYRLKVLDIAIPPLRDRRGDLPILLQHFLRLFVPADQKVPAIAPRAWAALLEYSFPGNIREFAHAIEHAVVLARGGEIDLEHLPVEIAGSATPGMTADHFRPLGAAVHDYERDYIRRALELAGGKRLRAAELLGISRRNLWAKMRLYELSGPGDAESEGTEKE